MEFASKSLSASEQRWAQIEKELFSIVFGLERFHQYTYGRKVFVTTDHKPLESIMRKPLSETPRRLQSLLMRANRYNFELQWAKGSSLLIADTLSRATVNCVSSCKTEYEPKIHLPDVMLEKIREESEKDETQRELKEVIVTGFPECKSKLSNN